MSAAEALLNKSEQLERDLASKDNSLWRNFWILMLAVPLPLLVLYLVSIWPFDHYKFAPLAFLVVGVLVYLRSDRSFGPPRNWFSWAVLGFAVLLVLLGALTRFPWLAAVATILVVGSCLRTMRGPQDASLIGLTCPLLPVVQLPLGSGSVLVAQIQQVALWISSIFLDFFGYPHVVDGNTLGLPQRELLSSDLHSGVVSVFLFAFLACLLVSWKRVPLLLLPVYLAVSVVLAVVSDVVRIMTITATSSSAGMDITTGVSKWIFDISCIVILSLLLLSFHRLIRVFFQRTGASNEAENPILAAWDRHTLPAEQDILNQSNEYQDSVRSNAQRRVRYRSLKAPLRWSFITSMIAVLVFSTIQAARKPKAIVQAAEMGSILFDPPKGIFSDFEGDLKLTDRVSDRDGTNTSLGAFSDTWSCDFDQAKVQVALSQPFRGWRELTDAYEGSSWKLIDRSIRAPSVGSNEENFAVGRLRQTDTEDFNGYLFYTAIETDGTVLPAPTEFGALQAKFLHRLNYAGLVAIDEVMMLQMWVVSNGKLPPSTVRALESEFEKIRSELVHAIKGTSADEPTLLSTSSEEPSDSTPTSEFPSAVMAGAAPLDEELLLESEPAESEPAETEPAETDASDEQNPIDTGNDPKP